MKQAGFAGLLLALLPAWVMAHGDDDPLLYGLSIDQFELRASDGPDARILEGSLWAGYDLHKLSFEVDIERAATGTEGAELQLVYSRAIAPYWDLHAGWRHNQQPRPTRDGVLLGVAGTAPYNIETGLTAVVMEHGHVVLELEAEYEWLLSQQLALVQAFDLNALSKDDLTFGNRAGLTDLEIGLRMHYALEPQFSPYIGLNYNRLLGNTADLARANGEDDEDLQLVVGISAWF